MKHFYLAALALISQASFGISPISTQLITVQEAKDLGFRINSLEESWATIYEVTPIPHNNHKCSLSNISSGFPDHDGNFGGQIFLHKSGIPSEIDIAVPLGNSNVYLSFDYICEIPSPITSMRYTITF